MSDDYTTKVNNLIRQITINIRNNNMSGALKDSETLKATLDALRASGNNIEMILQKIKEGSLISFENIECIISDPTCYVFTNTLKRNDGEVMVSKLYNHIENNEQQFRSAITQFQSNLIENKCLELMACTNDMVYEEVITVLWKVLQFQNQNMLDTFVDKLCRFEYPGITINHLMEIFLIDSHQSEFIVSEMVRDGYIMSMSRLLEREDVLVEFSKCLFDDNVSTELLHKCCQHCRGFFNLIQTVIIKYLNFIDQLETDDGDLLWYFKNENLSTNIKFNDFAKFIFTLTSSTELSFTNEFLFFLKDNFPSNLLNYVFAKFQ